MKYNDVIETQVVTDVASFSAEPVTLEEIKRHLNLQFDTSGSYVFTDDDTKLQEIAKASREVIEQYTGVSMASKTLKSILRNECGNIEIPMGPVTTLTSIKDVDGVALVSGTGYTVRGNQFRWIESPLSCYLEVNYVAGYTKLTIPAGLKRALLEQIAFDYANAGDQQQQYATANVAICESALAKAAPYSRKSMIA
jgi:uncharacterized phiE125 gp8 family phage protein